MNDYTIAEWKAWFENIERRKLTEGSIPLTDIRPRGVQLKKLSDAHDGGHCYFNSVYQRAVRDDG